MRKYLIHLQAIYPALSAAVFTFLLTFVLVRYINPIYSELTLFLLLFGFVWVMLFILDSMVRFRHYMSAVQYLRNDISDFEKLLHHEKIAWCTRESVKAACRQYSEETYKKAVAYYRARGIYYYHIFPEHMFSKGSPIFKVSFWKVAFFDFRKKNYLKDLHE